MRNLPGVIIAALGIGLVAAPFSRAIALVLAGVVLLLGAVFLLIDWDAR